MTRMSEKTQNRSVGNSCIEDRLSRLRECIATGDEDRLQQVVFELGPLYNRWQCVPDEVVEGLLTILRNENMYKSHLAGHILNYFEFESKGLTSRQKNLCVGFLNAHGDQFDDTHAVVVITELRNGNYLK